MKYAVVIIMSKSLGHTPSESSELFVVYDTRWEKRGTHQKALFFLPPFFLHVAFKAISSLENTSDGLNSGETIKFNI